MIIDLSQDEKNIVAGLLEKELDEIRSELRHTQGHDYKEGLKGREAQVRGLLASLFPNRFKNLCRWRESNSHPRRPGRYFEDRPRNS
jgi:hypothetical protein